MFLIFWIKNVCCQFKFHHEISVCFSFQDFSGKDEFILVTLSNQVKALIISPYYWALGPFNNQSYKHLVSCHDNSLIYQLNFLIRIFHFMEVELPDVPLYAAFWFLVPHLEATYHILIGSAGHALLKYSFHPVHIKGLMLYSSGQVTSQQNIKNLNILLNIIKTTKVSMKLN